MAYIVDKNKYSGYQSKNTIDIRTLDNSSGRSFENPKYLFFELEPAEVIDIILNDTHPEYKDYRDIGKIKVRMIYSDTGKAEADLPYARPLDINIKKYPLKHEIVVVTEYLDNIYYLLSNINIINNVNNNSIPTISTSPESNEVANDKKSNRYNEVRSSGVPLSSNDNSEVSLGDTFKIKDVLPLQPQEGDVIIEGRFGNTIRLGSNIETNEPTLKLRVMQPIGSPTVFESPYIEENINEDGSSIWMTSDEDVPLSIATKLNSSHYEFASTIPTTLSGKQIVLNSDRVVINAKGQQILLTANQSVNISATSEVTVDTDGKVITNSKVETVVNSPKIYLGAKEATEPLVLGNKLADWLDQVLSALIAHKHGSGTGPTTPPLPPELATLQRLKSQIQTLLSPQNFTL